MTAGIIIGVGLLVYPTIADYWNSFHQSKAIMSYNESVASLDREDYERILLFFLSLKISGLLHDLLSDRQIDQIKMYNTV